MSIINDLQTKVVTDTITNFYSCTLEEIAVKSRRSELNHIRQMLCLFLVIYTENSYATIGKMINRNHATVIHAKNKMIDDYYKKRTDIASINRIFRRKKIIPLYLNRENTDDKLVEFIYHFGYNFKWPVMPRENGNKNIEIRKLRIYARQLECLLKNEYCKCPDKAVRRHRFQLCEKCNKLL